MNRNHTLFIAGVLALLASLGLTQMQTSAQAPAATRDARLLRAEERQADALENVVRELRTTNDRLRSIERSCR